MLDKLLKGKSFQILSSEFTQGLQFSTLSQFLSSWNTPLPTSFSSQKKTKTIQPTKNKQTTPPNKQTNKNKQGEYS